MDAAHLETPRRPLPVRFEAPPRSVASSRAEARPLKPPNVILHGAMASQPPCYLLLVGRHRRFPEQVRERQVIALFSDARLVKTL